jgi:hypothetical protein
MKRLWMRLSVLTVLLTTALTPGLLWGQDAEGETSLPPLVVFIEESRQLDMASVTIEGPTGLSRLAAIFRELGARTEFARLREPLPEDVAVIVLVRPRRPIPADYLARIWMRVEQGANLLLAVDPSGHVGASTESPTGGVSRLLTLDYGIPLFSGLLMQPWFTRESISALDTSFLPAFPYPVANTVNQPLVDYQLPLITWGARPVGAELFGVDSAAFPLIYASAQYAEANARSLSRNNPDPLEINIGTDPLGRMVLGAVGENQRTNTRVAILGDGELLQNDFGLDRTVTAQGIELPLYPGNTILAQQIAAWLLEVPPESYLPLPPGYTWIAVDGERLEWDDAVTPPTVQTSSVVNVLSLRIQQARALRNDSYVYLMVETAAQVNPDAQLELQLDSRGSGIADTFVIANGNGVFLQQPDGTRELIADAQFGVGAGVEVRLPLRVTGFAPAIPGICLTTATPLAFATPPDCLTSPVPIVFTDDRDPADVHPTEDIGLMVMTRTDDAANVREGPGTNFNIVVGLRSGRLLRAIGRTASGEWVQVQTARYTGWISDLVYIANGDVMTLPVVEGT